MVFFMYSYSLEGGVETWGGCIVFFMYSYSLEGGVEKGGGGIFSSIGIDYRVPR